MNRHELFDFIAFIRRTAWKPDKKSKMCIPILIREQEKVLGFLSF